MIETKIIIPLYKSSLTPDERISLSVILHTMSQSRIVFIAPSSLRINFDTGEIWIERFDDRFFTGIAGYNRLLMSAEFYERFTASDYILICQLDCLVFSDALEQWASRGYDYIAAPWFKRFVEDPSAGLWRVGNGGFSLRNVYAHLRVLKRRVIRGKVYPDYGSRPWEPTNASDEQGSYQKLSPKYQRLNPFTKWCTVEEELQHYFQNEDLFWSLEAPKFDPNFKIPSAQDALPFAFEMAPRWCFETNGWQLPFGCHAWTRYDRSFWEDVLAERQKSHLKNDHLMR